MDLKCLEFDMLIALHSHVSDISVNCCSQLEDRSKHGRMGDYID